LNLWATRFGPDRSLCATGRALQVDCFDPETRLQYGTVKL
jgi:hypothetical protein